MTELTDTGRPASGDVEALAEDYTACGVALIGRNIGGGGTARVNVYCELSAGHHGTHAAAIEWDEPPCVVRIAQGSAKLFAAERDCGCAVLPDA